MVLRLFTLLPRFLLCKASRGGQSSALVSVSVLVVQRFRDLGPLQEHPSSSCPTGTATRTQGLGRSPPHGWGRELSTRGHVAGRHDNGSKAMINSNNPNTPPRGSTLLYFYAGKRKRKNKSGAARLAPARREARAASGAQADSLSRFTRARWWAAAPPPPPSRYDGVGAGCGHH